MHESISTAPAAASIGDDLQAGLRALLQRSRLAAFDLATAGTDRKNAFLDATARLLRDRAADLLAANARDVVRAEAAGRAGAFLERLRLDDRSLDALIRALREVAALPDPVGVVTSGSRRPNGLEVRRQRIPLGVIGIVYESRPNVTVDAASLCIKSGNAVVLRGGSEASHSNAAFVELLRDALAQAGLPPDAVQQPPSPDRAVVEALVGIPDGLDLVIPRGGTALIDAVNRAARVPVIQHYQGVCHVFVHAAAEPDLAARVVVNAKTQRPGVCNAAEAILVDAACADTMIPRLVAELRSRGTEIRGCPRVLALTQGGVVPATADDYGHEFLDLVCLMCVVDGIDGAIAHIRAHGSHHTEAILTQDLAAAQRFTAEIDASCVLVNASTRFNDGGCLGLGAEIGISTTKLHAYGPMGLESLTTEKFVVIGAGQVRT